MPGNDDFGNVAEEKFRRVMRPRAIPIYKRLFPGCELEDLRAEGFKVHVLDKEFAIDSLLKFVTGQWITVQEKYRQSNYWTNYHDFTQEYENGDHSQGEWFHLAAQLYFYGWANSEKTDFAQWLLIDVARYKILIEKSGGIEKVGRFQRNRSWYEGGSGQATFYGLSLSFLKPAILKHFNVFDGQGRVRCPQWEHVSYCRSCGTRPADNFVSAHDGRPSITRTWRHP